MLLLVGAAAFRFLVVRRVAPEQPGVEGVSAGMAALAAWCGIAACLARLPLQVVDIRDDAAPLLPQVGALLFHTLWGPVWIAQVVLMLAGVMTWRAVKRGRRGWAAAAGVSVLLAPTLSLSGHAVASERFTALAVSSDIVHVLAGGAWLGAMAPLLGALAWLHRHADEDASAGATASRLVSTYSPMALWSATLLLGTGVIAAWLHLGTVAALWQSRYGKMLLLKLAAVGAMAGAGALNWKREGPALAKTGEVGPIRSSIRREIGLGLVVIILTAVLVVTPEPGSE